MLQAFIDDSISNRGDQRLFLAGYLAHEQTWNAFCEHWARTLHAEPSIRFMHMVEAQNLRGEFAGWTPEDRDAKVVVLAQLIRSFGLFSFEASVSTADYKTFFAGRTPFGLAKAYPTALYGVTSALARYVYICGGREPIHFVFDTQEGADKDIASLWAWLKLSSPGPWRDLLGPPPRFADDTQEVALQAADMLAWHRRREHEGLDPPNSRSAADLLVSDPHLAMPISSKALASVARKMERMPGVKGMRSKKDWQQTRQAIAVHQQAGLPPPRLGPRMTFLMFTLTHPRITFRNLRSSWLKSRGLRKRRDQGR